MIIRHSPDARSILKRKIVTREVLFNYLDTNKVKLYPPHTKENLITKFLSIDTISTQDRLNTRPDEDSNTAKNDINLSTQVAAPPNNIDQMALKFSEWFYKMFNENQVIDTSHFWQDCNLRLNLKSGESIQKESVEGNSQEAVGLLFRIKMEHNILLNPNLLPEGCQGRMDLHGVVLVLACGTIHQNNLCVGVFEQVFALVRDPLLDNNWKIKFSELNLRSQAYSAAPRLTDDELTSSLLQLADS